VGGPCGFGSTGPELAGAHPDGASPEGAQDLAGNVAEWVAARPDDRSNPEGAARGGSFVTALATDLRTWQTRALPATTRSVEVGVRCAYDLPP
jgi:formylglycine-generating enzyme required for sulfatase activity